MNTRMVLSDAIQVPETSSRKVSVAKAPVRGPRRRISPEAGKALEKLGHAIDYLIDEFVHAGGNLSSDCPEVQAIEMLKSVNRQIYFDCPIVPSPNKRMLNFLSGLKEKMLMAGPRTSVHKQ